MAMKQTGTDYGSKKGETGEREPKGATSSDTSGEKTKSMKNGVAMGQAAGTGGRSAGGPERGEMNTGRSESTCYNHKRIPHAQD